MPDIVLIGGGHAHLFVLEAFANAPLTGARLTLITREAFAPYSGMLPGRVSGQYAIDSGEVDLKRMAERAGARFIHASATAIDRAARHVVIEGDAPVPYDLLSLDIGIVPDVASIPGAAENALIVKPISTFRRKLDGLLADLGDGRVRDLVVVGGGPAGFELAHALRRRADRMPVSPGGIRVTLAAGRRLLGGVPERGRRLARRSLAEAGVDLVEGTRAVRIDPDAVILDDGRSLGAQAAIVTTRAAAPEMLGRSGLAVDGSGFLKVRPTLQAEDDDRLFAAGDCVTLLGQERPKAGVFAVRQGPVLAENLRRAAQGRALRPYRAQRHYLMLLADSRGKAIALRNGLAIRSRLAFWLKDRIDRGFVDRFDDGS
ncbi:FAD-dependent oxidoreductase [Aurantimonas sp. 22II-16-19i]|uniref:FAD-dependent oxidoreductase n=1 Tax=Aurantimonas sp. 22II-16-19i TaxID=1317114 RepID=UPI0009F7AA36|nr:FAD-dependent oxidoreductase [Aurantimonas sp. 22II-16-19i]ORE97664.1 selenide water dikinase [Aurantimonas sp. 22II-16-19i]